MFFCLDAAVERGRGHILNSSEITESKYVCVKIFGYGAGSFIYGMWFFKRGNKTQKFCYSGSDL
jgi:hypothetical protein